MKIHQGLANPNHIAEFSTPVRILNMVITRAEDQEEPDSLTVCIFNNDTETESFLSYKNSFWESTSGINIGIPPMGFVLPVNYSLHIDLAFTKATVTIFYEEVR